jgi:HEPN domain-containing protein
MNKQDHVREWITMADVDIEAAMYLTGMRPQPMGVICFHCQQSAEKYLKAFLLSRDELVPKIHDLAELNRRCFRHDSDFASIETQCIRLTSYAVETRYPYFLDLNEADVRMAIHDAGEIKRFVSQKIEIS